MPSFKDLTGQRFGRLTVVGLDSKRFNGKRYHYYWRCICDCGEEHIVRTDSLTSGGVRSCGCLLRENARENAFVNVSAHYKHKQSRTPIYHLWQGIKKRCLDTNSSCYPRYGGRGITICDKWRNDFQAFFDYVSKLEHYGEIGYTIDRVDNNGNYEPGNVRWADAKTQCRNRRSNVIVEYDGQQMTLTEAAELSGVDFKTLHARIRRGDSGDKLFRSKGENPKFTVEINDRKYTVKEIAEIAGVSTYAIYQRYKAGRRGKELLEGRWSRHAHQV